MKLLSEISLTIFIIIAITYIFLPYYLPPIAKIILKKADIELLSLEFNHPSLTTTFISELNVIYQNKKIMFKNSRVDYKWQGFLPTDFKLLIEKLDYADQSTQDIARFSIDSRWLKQSFWRKQPINKISISEISLNDTIATNVDILNRNQRIYLTSQTNKPFKLSTEAVWREDGKLNINSKAQQPLNIKAKIILSENNNVLKASSVISINKTKINLQADYHISSGYGTANIAIHIQPVEIKWFKEQLEFYTNKLPPLNFSKGLLTTHIFFNWDNKSFPRIYYVLSAKETAGTYKKNKFEGLTFAINGLYDKGLFASGTLRIDKMKMGSLVKIKNFNTDIGLEQEAGSLQIILSNLKAKLFGGKIGAKRATINYLPLTVQMEPFLQDIDLSELVKQLDFKKIQASGTIKGRFNINYSSKNGIEITNGSLSNQGEGIIHYKNNNEKLQFLQDLSYQALEVLLNYESNNFNLSIIKLRAHKYIIEEDKPFELEIKDKDGVLLKFLKRPTFKVKDHAF